MRVDKPENYQISRTFHGFSHHPSFLHPDGGTPGLLDDLHAFSLTLGWAEPRFMQLIILDLGF